MMLGLRRIVNKAKRKTLPLILASTLAFTPIRAFAETKKVKYAEEVFIDNKFYTVQVEDKSYIVEPSSSADVAEKALFVALVKHEIEDGYFSDAFKKESNKLNRLLFKEAVKLTGKCIEEAITDPIKKLKDPVGLLGSLRGITGLKSFVKFSKGFFSTWWTNLPSTLERRAVDPKLYAYRIIGQGNRSFDEMVANARKLLKDGFTYEEAKEAYSYLKEIKAGMPHLIQFVKDIGSSKDPRFKVNERDLKELQILEWEGYGKNRHIAAEDEQKLEELRERIFLRVESSEEYKRCEKAIESAKSKTLEEIVVSYELTERDTAADGQKAGGASLTKLIDSFLTILPNGVKIEHEKIAASPYTRFAEYEGDYKGFIGRVMWPWGDSNRIERSFWEQGLKIIAGNVLEFCQSSIKVGHIQKPHDGIPEAFAIPKLKEQGDGFLVYVFFDEDYIKKFGIPSLSYLYRPENEEHLRLVYAGELNFSKKEGIFLSVIDTSKNTFPQEIRKFRTDFYEAVTFLIGHFGQKNFNVSEMDASNFKKILHNQDYFALGFL